MTNILEVSYDSRYYGNSRYVKWDWHANSSIWMSGEKQKKLWGKQQGLEKRPCSKAKAIAVSGRVSWPLRLVVKKKKGTCMVVHVKAIRCFSWRYKVSLLQVKELSTALFAFACGIAGCHCGPPAPGPLPKTRPPLAILLPPSPPPPLPRPWCF